MNVQIIASQFNGIGKKGDFNYMIKRDMSSEEDPLTLYIYNDNCESYYSNSYRAGAGNAIIRQYNKFNPKIKRPFSAGIPTGSFEHGGFSKLDNVALHVIRGSLDMIKKIIETYSIKTIYYSTNNNIGTLGTSIFDVNEDVINYITNKIKKLSLNPLIVEFDDNF